MQGDGAEASIAGEPAARLRPAPVPEEGEPFDFETTFPKPSDDSGIPTEQTANTHSEVMDVLRAARTEDAPEVYRNVLDVYRQTFGDDAARQLDERISKEVDDGRSRVQPDAADGERGAEGVARPADAEGQVVGNEAAEGRAAASLEDVGDSRARAVEDQAARDGTKPAVGETKPAEAETIAGVPEAPAAQPDAAARGAPERADLPSGAVAQRPAEAQAPEGVEDYTTRKGEVKTFATKKEAELFRAENRVPKTYSPRKSGRGEWTLSRAARSEDEVQRQAEKAQRQYRERARIKPTDSLATMIGKLGGISRDELLRDGVDPADLKQLRSGVVGRPVARAKGLSLDALAEHLDGYGFDLRDEHGAIDASKLRDLIDEELQGNSVHTPEGYEHLASMAADARERAERLHRENNFSEDDLRRAGYDDLSEEAQTFLQHAFEEEADRHLATKDTKETISDEEAGRLFDEWAQATEEQVPGARAGRAREGAEGAETAARHEGEPSPAGVDKPALELKGETEQEIRNREALAKRKQAEQAARDKAPNPEDFALTGSDRAVDVAEAHGQDALFSRNSGPHRARNIDALARDLAPKVHDAPNGTKIIANGQVAFSKERNVMNLGGGDRRVTFTIHDRTRPDANGKATAGGALIVDMDKYGLFKGIRSIEIHRDLRQKGIGLGERAVAMMIAHNKGAPIEVHDIQHAGVQGTAADALPFWRKMGVRLRNFSSDPNVAMDGVLKRDDYLNALDERGKVWRSDGTLTGNDRLEEGARAPESGAPQPDAGAGQGKRGSGGDDRPGGPAEGAGREAGRDVKPDEPKLARREQPTEKAPQRGLSSAELSDVAKRLDVAARVVDTEAELPDHLRKQIEAQGASGDVRGVYDPTTGAVWLVGSAIHSPVEAVTVALHESAHRGLAKLFGPELRPILGEIYARNDLVRTRANGMMREFKYTQARATEEVLADMALHGSARNLNGWERFVSFVRDWLLKRGVKFDLSDDAVEFIAGAAAKAGKEGVTHDLPESLQGRFSRDAEEPKAAEVNRKTKLPDWAQAQPKPVQDALKKAGFSIDDTPLKDRIGDLWQRFKGEFRQGVADQLAPIAKLDYRAYMQARLSKGTDGGLEALMLYGKPKLTDGALDVDYQQGGGFIKEMQKLGGEHDRFFAWVAGNRAAQLKAEGRENLFGGQDIGALKDLNRGKMDDGRPRDLVYGEALKALNGYGKAVLDIAEKTGLIDGASRHVWEREFYVPFYRNIEDGVSGPNVKSGLVSQSAFKRLKGGEHELNDLLANTLRNWSHLLSASMKNEAATSTLKAAAEVGAAERIPAQEKGAVHVLDHGAEVWYRVNDPLITDAITSLEFNGFKGPLMEWLSKPKYWLTFGVTKNPAFMIRNTLRDTISAIAATPVSYNPFKNLAEGWAGTKHDSEARAKLMAGGGMVRFGTMLEGSRAEHSKRLIEEGVDPEYNPRQPAQGEPDAEARLGHLQRARRPVREHQPGRDLQAPARPGQGPPGGLIRGARPARLLEAGQVGGDPLPHPDRAVLQRAAARPRQAGALRGAGSGAHGPGARRHDRRDARAVGGVP
jgi:hypothetical protein